MNAEQHPEDALDRAIAGELPAWEQQTLNRHLAVCRACATHLILARSGQRVLVPQPWDDQLNRHAVDRALVSFDRKGWLTKFSVVFRPRWALLAAGILLTLGSMASAAWWHLKRPDREALPPMKVASSFAPVQRTRKLVNTSPDTTSSVALVDDGRADRATLHRTVRTQPSAASLFEEGSALRDRDKTDQSIVVFRKLQQLYPKARETRISFALAGRMLLDYGRPAQALSQFDQHLALGGEASEDALAGRATALGQMGRTSAESETWRRLLAAYPRTVYASQAKDRLSGLGGPPNAPVGIESARSADGVGRERSERRR
jgi:hypothetical protein